jgi:hypothetical protein
MSGETNGALRGGKRRRIWCETLPLTELADGPALGWLGPRAVHPIVAVRPSDEVDLVARVVLRARELGLEPAVWPMLEDAAGRWCSAENVEAFARFAEALLAALASRGASPGELAIDLEPPIVSVRAAFVDRAADVWAPLASRAPLGPAVKRLAVLIERAGGHGVRCSAAFAPPVLLDAPPRRAWQRLLGTPVDGLAWASAGPMLYTSLFEGWSRGLVDRAGARALLARGCSAARGRFGASGSASLGCVGPGALETEPVYRSVAELADDVAVARAAGVDDLALFDLGGISRRSANGAGAPPPEAWLDAFVETSAAASLPELPVALRALLGAGAFAARLLPEPSW